MGWGSGGGGGEGRKWWGQGVGVVGVRGVGVDGVEFLGAIR